MPTSRSDSKRQARLTFTPLPSSSPARQSQHEAVRDRAAAVTLSSGGRALRSQGRISDWTIPPELTLPTPEPKSSKKSTEHFQRKGSLSRSSRPSFMSSGMASTKRRRIVIDESDSEDGRARDSPVQSSIPSSPPGHDDDSDSLPIKRTPNLKLPAPKVATLDTSDEEELDTPTKRHTRDRVSPKKGASSRPVLESDDDDEDDEPIFVSSKKLHHRTRSPARNEEVEDLMDSDSDGKSRKAKSSRKRSTQEEQDIAADLDFLSSPEIVPRSVDTKKGARSKLLEKLKQHRLKRGSGSGEVQEDSSESDGDDAGIDEDYSGFDWREASEEKDFIVEDDDDAEPVDLPAQFSNLRRAKLGTLFKYMVEWMVQKKFNPAFRSEDEVYQIAFDRLNAFASQMGGSKFHSAAWTQSFSKALRSYPYMNDTRIYMGQDKCEACNKTGYPTTYEIEFYGSVYNGDTLEEVSEDESSEPLRTQVFAVGKTCCANAKMAHSFAHWRYNLNTWIVDYLRQEGHLKPAKIVERDSWKTSRRERYANEVVDGMEDDGQLKSLYRDFKNSISQAQHAGSLDPFTSSP